MNDDLCIAYVISNALALAKECGPRPQMTEWCAGFSRIDPTVTLYTTRPGDDVQRCFLDQPYFQSLVNDHDAPARLIS